MLMIDCVVLGVLGIGDYVGIVMWLVRLFVIMWWLEFVIFYVWCDLEGEFFVVWLDNFGLVVIGLVIIEVGICVY